VRERRFEEAQRVPALAHAEVAGARRIALLISIATLLVSGIIALHLARLVVTPLRHIKRCVDAVQQGRLDERLPTTFRDELGDLAVAFNQMAEHLTEFQRSNLGEVLRAKATLEATLQALPDAVVLFDPTGRIVSMNARATELFADRRAAPREATELVLEGFNPEEVLRFLVAPKVEGSADLSRAIRLIRGGRLMRLLPRLVSVPGPEHGATGAILVLYDVTDLAQLDERRAELVAVASHELQTPLTTLRMTLLMLNEGASALTAAQRQVLATSLGGVEQLAVTVNRYLDLTRIEAEQMRLEWDRLDFSGLVTNAVAQAEMVASDARVAVAVEVERELPTIWGDASRLRIVLDNVLSNAVKYTPPGGRIDVRARRWQNGGPAVNGLRLEVSDSGPGVPAEFRERIFEKFFRVEHHQSGGDRGVRGAGIGLYLARQIVDRHGGSICCDAGPAGGARIVMHLSCDRRA
jgi:two-component system, NtrC family, sensor histidine kinase KinB